MYLHQLFIGYEVQLGEHQVLECTGTSPQVLVQHVSVSVITTFIYSAGKNSVDTNPCLCVSLVRMEQVQNSSKSTI